jgi:dihydrofolate reductase
MSSVTLIAAMDKNGLIGKDNKLPWHIPIDLKFFKQQTSGKTVLMGRKTCESLPFPLPQRRNVVITRNKNFSKPGFEIIHEINQSILNDELMVIGGSTIYQLMMPFTDAMIITKINHEFIGDTYFPEINWSNWINTRTTHIPISAENKDYIIDFEFYKRITKN